MGLRATAVSFCGRKRRVPSNCLMLFQMLENSNVFSFFKFLLLLGVIADITKNSYFSIILVNGGPSKDGYVIPV